VFADFAPAALIPNKDVKLLERLGEGGFAKVYQGLLTKGVSSATVGTYIHTTILPVLSVGNVEMKSVVCPIVIPSPSSLIYTCVKYNVYYTPCSHAD
jgi:hypothetical protein